MKSFTLDTGWDTARADLRYTIATTRAAGEHDEVRAPLAHLLGRWTMIEGQRVVAEDAVADAGAAVAWVTGALERAVGRFAVQLAAVCDNDRSRLIFQAYFPERPSAVRDLALEAMVERVAKWGDVQAKFPLAGAAAGALTEVERLVTRGDDALDERERATAALAGVSLDMKAWREEANLARRAAEVALDQHATDKRLDRAYSADFFPKPKKKPKAKADDKAASDVAAKPAPPPPSRVPPANVARPSAAPVH